MKIAPVEHLGHFPIRFGYMAAGRTEISYVLAVLDIDPLTLGPVTGWLAAERKQAQHNLALLRAQAGALPSGFRRNNPRLAQRLSELRRSQSKLDSRIRGLDKYLPDPARAVAEQRALITRERRVRGANPDFSLTDNIAELADGDNFEASVRTRRLSINEDALAKCRDLWLHSSRLERAQQLFLTCLDQPSPDPAKSVSRLTEYELNEQAARLGCASSPGALAATISLRRLSAELNHYDAMAAAHQSAVAALELVVMSMPDCHGLEAL